MTTGPGICAAPLGPVLFDAHGTVPIGYAAFAFALGVTAGVLIRHTVPAMAATLAVYAGVQIAVPLWIRPHLIAPLRNSSPLDPAGISGLTMGSGGRMSVFPGVDLPGAWVISNQAITRPATCSPARPPQPARAPRRPRRTAWPHWAGCISGSG